MSDSESKPGEKKLVTIKNAADLQRLKIDKLMKNPDKPVVIPERPKQKALAAPPDFVRNVMGSSAGAGSGEFHVYRHLRRKEYARQKFIQEKSEKEKLDEEYHMKIEKNRRAAEEKTAKKRAKRLRKKKNAKLKCKKQKNQNQNAVSSQSDNSSNDDENDEKIEISTDHYEDTRQSNLDCKILDNEEQSHDKQATEECSEHKNKKRDVTTTVIQNISHIATDNKCQSDEQNENISDSV